jgi:hypothetical protein
MASISSTLVWICDFKKVQFKNVIFKNTIKHFVKLQFDFQNRAVVKMHKFTYNLKTLYIYILN